MENRQYPLRRQKKDVRDFVVSTYEFASAPLKKVDLRYICPDVLDQESLGSCSANAGVTAQMMLESDTKNICINDIPLLSRLFLYYQERVLEGTVDIDSGAEMRDICKALYKVGVCEEKYMPYDITKFTETPSSIAIDDAKNHMIGSYKALKSLNEIRQYISNNTLPVLMGIDVYESFESEAVAKSGLIPVPNTKKETLLGGHAILVVGYDDNFVNSAQVKTNFLVSLIRKICKLSISKGALICRNSWGPDWGDKGYFYLPYDFIIKGLAFDFWTIGAPFQNTIN